MPKKYALLLVYDRCFARPCGVRCDVRVRQETVVNSDPWAYVPTHLIHTDHSSIVQGPFNSGQEVTQACLECHADSADAGHAHHPLDLGRRAGQRALAR